MSNRVDPKNVRKSLPQNKQPQKKEEDTWDRLVDWASSLFSPSVEERKKGFQDNGGMIVDGSKSQLHKRATQVTTKKAAIVAPKVLSITDPEYITAKYYVTKKGDSVRNQIISKRQKVYDETWDRMVKEIHAEIKAGKSFEDIKKKYEEGWIANFSISFDDVFKYAKPKTGQSFTDFFKPDAEKEKEIGLEIAELKKKGFYDELDVLFSERWKKEVVNDSVLAKSLKIMRDTQKAENERKTKEAIKILESIKLGGELKSRYEKIMQEAKVQDYIEEEIEIAQNVVKEFFTAFKQQLTEKNLDIDMDLWRKLVAMEPVLAKAEALLFQKSYEMLGLQFKQRALAKKRQDNDLSPEELLKQSSELSFWENNFDLLSVFFKTMLPWNQIEATESLRADGKLVTFQAIPIQEMQNMVSWAVRKGGGDRIGNVFDFGAHQIGKVLGYATGALKNFGAGAFEMVREIAEGEVDKYGNEVAWNRGKNRYVLSDFTIEAKEGVVARGIKWLMKGIVGEPEEIKSKKLVPWLAKYGKAAAAGVAVAVVADLTSLRMPGQGTLVKGIFGGLLYERYKGQIKAAVAFAIPGALAAAGVIVGIAGVGALIGTGGILIVGLAATLFGIFGVYALYYTEKGREIREGIASWVYSDEIAWFNQWNERKELAEVNRAFFKQAANAAEARKGQMYLRIELGKDQRYKNLKLVCNDTNLSEKAKDAFLEQIRRNPRVLSNSEKFDDLIKLMPFELRKELDDKISDIKSEYLKISKDILKVGLEKRYEKFKNILKTKDPIVSGIINSLESGEKENDLKDDAKFRKMLIMQGISPEAIDWVMDTHSGRKKVELEKKQPVKTEGWAGYLGSLNPLRKAKTQDQEMTEHEQAQLKIAKELTNNKSFIETMMLLREVTKRKDLLADQAELTKFLTKLGFKSNIIDSLFESDLIIEPEGGKVYKKLIEDQRAMQEEILVIDIIRKAYRSGDLKSDADLLTNAEIAEINNSYADDAEVLKMLEKDRDIDIPSKEFLENIAGLHPPKPGAKPIGDSALMLRFNMERRDFNGRILNANELPENERKRFIKKKTQFIRNIDRLRIELKRKKLVQAAKDKLIQEIKNKYVAKILASMSEDEKKKRIDQYNFDVLAGYGVNVV